jgi:acetyl-CoA acetyltransferase
MTPAVPNPVYITGAGMTRFAKQPGRTLKDLTHEAVGDALASAGLTAGDVQQAYFANALGGVITNQEMVPGQIALRGAGIAGIPVVNVENACASASTALHLGYQAVASGAAQTVLCVGAETMSHPDKRVALAAIGRATDVEEVFGPEGPQPGGRSWFMDLYAENARRYMQRSGATREDVAAVTVKTHHHGALNPRAQYGSEMTVEEVLAAREIVPPLTLPMCSPLSDGAAAVVLSADPAGGSRVRVAASTLTSGTPGGGPDNASARAARAAYEQAGVGPGDLDLVELHDAAAPAEIELYESLALVAAGDGPALVRDGATRLGGPLPVNVSGGLLSKGHPIGATGLAQAVEGFEQLRGEAGARQVEGARVALLHNGGGWLEGDNAAICVTILLGEAAA